LQTDRYVMLRASNRSKAMHTIATSDGVPLICSVLKQEVSNPIKTSLDFTFVLARLAVVTEPRAFNQDLVGPIGKYVGQLHIMPTHAYAYHMLAGQLTA
jgi:hypothetical protein